MSDSTSQSGGGPGGGADDEVADSTVAQINRALIETATGPGIDDPTVRRLAAQLSENKELLDSLMDLWLGDATRLGALHRTGLMAGEQKDALDRIATLTAEALGAPYAAISLVDKDTQLLAGCSIVGEDFTRSRPIEFSVCKFAVVANRPLIVEDMTAHPLLAKHPVVTSGEVLAYAGVLLTDDDGNTIGTLCIWDDHPRRWTGPQIQLLEDFAAIARKKVFEATSSRPK
ncbi:GAF domain-containing protein [Mycolicibacterium sp. S2-37]|uniref:GAF domain-containing protein n=1 Tax=Mycolicibacterium sp. S2-37 TaxID=2810297 RepID=UPI001A94D328|nr:GAF domain-containing protein [Mycolicibacterium sp. S2-37]MBO0679324.1 GAF domain-containing protein [Mycolicibacterium sp. S2-37]